MVKTHENSNQHDQVPGRGRERGRRRPAPGGRLARPGYQDDLVAGTARGVPDVSADANGHTGMALVISNGSGGYTISNSGGTSATAPFWAGVIALADQYAGHDLGFVNPALYRIASTALYRTAFHDITTGNNTVEFPRKPSPDTRPPAAGTRLPAWAAPTRRCSSRCSRVTRRADRRGRCVARSFDLAAWRLQVVPDRRSRNRPRWHRGADNPRTCAPIRLGPRRTS